MNLTVEPYTLQLSAVPSTGCHILAQYDNDSLIVYQAFRPEIGHFAATNGFFDKGFSLDRMSWIKTSFLWMMYRSGWGTKPGQEVVLAVWLKRECFCAILDQAVHSHFMPALYPSQKHWQSQSAESNVVVQWDPDRDPQGKPLQRRAIQLGLRKKVLAQYAKEWLLHIEDITDFVAAQRPRALNTEPEKLTIPVQRVYPITDAVLAKKLNINLL